MITFGILLLGGIFTGSVLSLALSRYSSWKVLEVNAFKQDFVRTIKAVDVTLPVMLIFTLILTLLFAFDAEGTSRTVAFLSAFLYLTIFVLSVAVLVPLQNSIIKDELSDDEVLAKKQIWQRGHLGRTVMSLVAFLLSIVAVIA